MTVIVTARLGHSKQSGAGQEPPLQLLVARIKECGCLHHDVLELGDEWWLIEEWESPEVFEDFFDRTIEFRQALREAGFREFPDDVRLWRPIKGENELRSAWRTGWVRRERDSSRLPSMQGAVARR
jgi:quinol monooxygenase YgiN